MGCILIEMMIKSLPVSHFSRDWKTQGSGLSGELWPGKFSNGDLLGGGEAEAETMGVRAGRQSFKRGMEKASHGGWRQLRADYKLPFCEERGGQEHPVG